MSLRDGGMLLSGMHAPRRALIAIAMLASTSAVLWGCGRSMLSLDESAGGRSSGTSSGAAPPDASGSDGSGEDAGSSPPVPTGIGTLVFNNSAGMYPEGTGTLVSSGFHGQFYVSIPTAGCATQHTGNCVYGTCPENFPPGAQATSAGTLTVSGGEIDGGLAVMPGMGDIYSFGNDPAANPPSAETLFQPGDTLTLSASGGVVPAFTAPPLLVPQSGTLVAPQPGPEGYYTVSTSQDLMVQWSGGEAGAQFALQGGNAGPTYTSFLCVWDATLGHGVVPQSMLAPFKQGGGINGELIWYQRRFVTVTAGGFTIQESVLQVEPGKEAAFY